MALPKRRLWMAMAGPVELAVTIDLRDLWIGMYWRDERYRNGHWDLSLFEVYVCPVPAFVLSARWRRTPAALAPVPGYRDTWATPPSTAFRRTEDT